MTKKYHNYTLQTNRRRLEEEAENNNSYMPSKDNKYKQHALSPQHDNSTTRKDTKTSTLHKYFTNYGVNNK